MATAFELRSTLDATARAAYLDGATDRQIDMIVAFARATGDFDISIGNHFTRIEASRIIDDFVSRGIVGDYNKSEAELDAEDEAKAQADAKAASRKTVKKQKAEAKSWRDAQKLEAQISAASGRKVRHSKFGLGDVVSEDDATVTAIFSGQKKALKIGKAFVVEV